LCISIGMLPKKGGLYMYINNPLEKGVHRIN